MATPIDDNFMQGFAQGTAIINNAQSNALNLMGRIQQVAANRMEMQQAAKLFPLRLKQLQMQGEAADLANQLKLQEMEQTQSDRRILASEISMRGKNPRSWLDATLPEGLTTAEAQNQWISIRGAMLKTFDNQMAILEKEEEIRARHAKPSAQTSAQEITDLLAQAQVAELNGDKELAASLRAKAAPRGTETTVFDPTTGKPIVQIGPSGSRLQQDITTATRSLLEREKMAAQGGIELVSRIMEGSTPTVWGGRGVINDVFSKGLGQLPGFEWAGNPQAVETRTAVPLLISQMVKAFKPDSQISKTEVDLMKEAFPSTTILESEKDALVKLWTLRNILKRHAERYAKELGKPTEITLPIGANTIKKLYDYRIIPTKEDALRIAREEGLIMDAGESQSIAAPNVPGIIQIPNP